MLSWLHNASRRRKAQEALKEFRFLIATPSNLGSQAAGTTFTLAHIPGPGRVALSGNVGFTHPQITLGGAVLMDAGANVVRRGRWMDETEAVTIVTTAALAPQTLKIYILDEWERPFQIATATVT